MTPEEAVRAAEELGARRFLPSHMGRFALAQHAWQEPLQRATKAVRGKALSLTTPRLGEPVLLHQEQEFARWWE